MLNVPVSSEQTHNLGIGLAGHVACFWFKWIIRPAHSGIKLHWISTLFVLVYIQSEYVILDELSFKFSSKNISKKSILYSSNNQLNWSLFQSKIHFTASIITDQSTLIYLAVHPEYRVMKWFIQDKTIHRPNYKAYSDFSVVHRAVDVNPYHVAKLFNVWHTQIIDLCRKTHRSGTGEVLLALHYMTDKWTL